ncbi:hypothetical protein T265_14136, partial [Opisthorchis viverrini]
KSKDKVHIVPSEGSLPALHVGYPSKQDRSTLFTDTFGAQIKTESCLTTNTARDYMFNSSLPYTVYKNVINLLPQLFNLRASPAPTPVPAFNEDGKSEAQIRMEQEAKRRRERAEEEWREYEEFRRGEREKAEEEIRQLKERRERRKAERAEEEKRLAEARLVEEQKRRAEEEERQRKKREEEQRKREERERKRQEWEEKKNANRPNFVINKREGGPEVQSAPQEEKKEEVTKSKEQLEAERRSIIDQRVPPLNVSGMTVEQLKAKAKELHDLLFRIEGENYDLGQRFKRQSYDMQELAERARQMNKGYVLGMSVLSFWLNGLLECISRL